MQRWLEKRYEALWDKFKLQEFSFAQAAKVLKEQFEDEGSQVKVILSELRKSKLLEASFDESDARRRIYRLRARNQILFDSVSSEGESFTRGDLERLVKAAADLIRTRVDYTFILLLLFYKRISDKWQAEFKRVYREAINDGFTEDEALREAKNSAYHDIDIPEDLLWDNIRKDPARLAENFSMAMKVLSEKNPLLRDMLENMDFLQFTSNRENTEILRQLVELFSTRSLENASPDLLGDAYEWILRYFAPQKAKEGEVYTPKEVIDLLVEITDPKPTEIVYDPACGAGRMLISAYKFVEEKYQSREEADKLLLFGQEHQRRTLSIAKMNLYIHDISNCHIAYGDTLLYPRFKDENGLKKFDVVIANPPWNQDGYQEDVLKKGEFWRERFRYGFPPRQSADWAWIQHMLTSAKDETGRIGVVIDNGCLFRGGKERAIRTNIINADLIESVLLLPEKLFYNTGAPGAIIILNKNKPEARREKILFINASQEYEKHPDIRKLNRLGKEHIEKIVKAYKEFKDIDGFSRVVEIKKIKENDYNLNVTLYVFPEEEIENIDVAKEWSEILSIDERIKNVTEKIEEYLKELGY